MPTADDYIQFSNGKWLHSIRVCPVPFVAAKRMIEQHHYLHSFPGGTMLSLGVFLDQRLLGAITLGVGPYNGFSLVEDAKPCDCITLTRLWLSDKLPRNTESHVIGIVLRALKKNTTLKFVISYSDPSHGHLGVIYQSSNWIYTGLSQTMPLYSLDGSKPAHSRSLGHVFGSHSVRFFSNSGLEVKIIPQSPKYRYIYLLDQSLKPKLRVPVLPYPKKEHIGESN